jgi:Tfp pilus assembly protein PilE
MKKSYHRCAQSGRSLIEMLGVIAIAGVMAAGAIKMYDVVRTRQTRMIATEEMKAIATNTKLLYAARQDYFGISSEYLIKAGAIKNDKSPLPGTEFSVITESGADAFALRFEGVDFKTCAWLAVAKFDWADIVSVNGYKESAGTYCKKVEKNEVSVWVK